MKELLENQYKNLFLWVPFVMAMGAAWYFSLDIEPNFHFPILITILLALVIYKNKNIFIRAIMLFLFGFFYSMSFTQIVDTPQLKYTDNVLYINGRVSDIDFTPDKTRLFIKIPANQIDNNLPPTKNTVIRVSTDSSSNINIGDNISGNVKLYHPAPKYAPDSFDFARWAYFNKISGTGFFIDYEIGKSENTTTNIRTHIHNRAKSNLTDALILGYKKSIPEHEATIWKTVGLGHIWSISGFHMTLIGGWLFAFFYLIFRSIPYITRRFPAKYPAMICAWVGLIFYLCISGISVATTRAFLMTTLIFIACIFGRNILSLRNAALAFLVLFLINPFFVMHAGFQLSFAAIFGLLWFFQDTQYVKRNFINRIIHILYATFTTTCIATIFTLPFIIAHFGYLPLYGLIGNLVLLPIFSVAIMPLVLIGTISTICGNYFILNLCHKIYLFTLNIAEHISNLPYANISLPNMSSPVLILFVIGLTCVILINRYESENFIKRHINYVFGGIFIIAAINIYIFASHPLFYATDDHKLVGFIYDNHLKFNKAKSAEHYFAFDTWYKFNNETAPDKNERKKCEKGLCIYKTPKWNLAYMQNFTAIIDNADNICKNKDINYIVTTFNITSTDCNAKILQDGVLIYPSGRIKNFSNHRPWHIQR